MTPEKAVANLKYDDDDTEDEDALILTQRCIELLTAYAAALAKKIEAKATPPAPAKAPSLAERKHAIAAADAELAERVENAEIRYGKIHSKCAFRVDSRCGPYRNARCVR
jgi:hypothetical protein